MYKILLLLFPRDMRAEFGAEMEELFRAHRSRLRGLQAARFWLALTKDALVHGIGARLDRPRSSQMLRQRWLMDIFVHDLRYALRALRRQPVTTATMLLTLALGIGFNTAVFSVVNTVLLRPLPYPDPERLVLIFEKRPAEGAMENPVAPADFLDWARLNQSFTSIGAYSQGTGDLTGAGDPVQLQMGAVTGGWFDVFGTHALVGRTLTAGDDLAGSSRVVVLSHALWRQRFGSDSAIVGRTITVNDVPREVIGVMPPDFEPPTPDADLWAPLVLQTGTEPPSRTSHYLSVYARLKPGVTFEAARSGLDALGQQLEAQHQNESRGHGAEVVRLADYVVKPVRAGLLVAAAAVGFVLLIGCTNVANILLARAATRRREQAVRAAIGASRLRLMRQALTESVVLAAAGGVIGLGVAYAVLQVLVSYTPPELRGVGLERATVDGSALGFTFALCVMTGMLAGMLPAWLAAGEDPNQSLRQSGRSSGGPRKRVRRALVVSEVALTCLLLIGAALLMRSFERVLSQPLGFETANRIATTVTLPRTRYSDAEALRRAVSQIEEQLRAIPGVHAVGATSMLPLTPADARRGITIEGYTGQEADPPTRAHLRPVTPQYFQTMGIRIMAGRPFAPTDNARAPHVVVVNETMAHRYWPSSSAIGKRIRFGEEPWRDVIGVVGDVRHWGLDQPANPELYMPYEQFQFGTMTFVLQTAAAAEVVLPRVAEAVQSVDPHLPIGTAQTLDEVASHAVSSRRWSAMLIGTFALLALVLAAVGIYGVMAQLVTSGQTEIGIRLSLGAKPLRILSGVLGESLLHTASGLGLGIALSLPLMRGVRSLLYEVQPTDLPTIVVVAVVLLVVGGAAGLVPALRAMRIDPVRALRSDQ
jgi:predicted permease